jgi:hypothetical protein
VSGDVLGDIDDVLRVNSLAAVESGTDALSTELSLGMGLIRIRSTVRPYGLLASRAPLSSTFPALLGSLLIALQLGTTLTEHSFGSKRACGTPLLARCR